MKPGIEIRYQDRKLVMPMERIRHAEKIGFDAVFAPEGHGSDSLTPLAFIAAHTSRIKLGSCITQIVGRTPTTTAMAFQTLEQLAGRGRVMAGLGSAMRETVEGWHGLPWGSPVSRMRDYVAIMRQAFDPSRTVDYRGKEWSIPYRGPNALPIQPMRSYLDTNPDIPILIGCGGTSMIKLSSEPGK